MGDFTRRDPAQPLSLTAYAKRKGVSKMAVSQAIASGRLSASVTRNARGQPKIADPELADQEWAANTDLSRAPAYVKGRAESPAETPPGEPDQPHDPSELATTAQPGMSLQAATALEKVWKAKLAELKYRQEAAELIPASQVRRTLENTFASCKTKLLAIPSRARQQLPELTGTQLGTIENLIREALEGLSEKAVP